MNELLVRQMLCRHVNEITLCGASVLPVHNVARFVYKAFQLADSLGQHRGVIRFIDHPVTPFVSFQKRRCKSVVSETTSAFPSSFFSNPTWIFAVNDALQARK